MAQQDQDRPNRAANQEQAEGSRETVDANVSDTGRERGDEGGGITNRPLGREQKEQDEVPPRGERKDGGAHA